MIQVCLRCQGHSTDCNSQASASKAYLLLPLLVTLCLGVGMPIPVGVVLQAQARGYRVTRAKLMSREVGLPQQLQL